jgi:hypothetical protein
VAFCQEIASNTAEIAKFPVNYPVSRELQAETGSYLTAHTTIPILPNRRIRLWPEMGLAAAPVASGVFRILVHSHQQRIAAAMIKMGVDGNATHFRGIDGGI